MEPFSIELFNKEPFKTLMFFSICLPMTVLTMTFLPYIILIMLIDALKSR